MTLYRVNLRNLTVAALQAANTIAGTDIYSPGDWPTNKDTMPAILVTSPRERKDSNSRAQPNFTVTAAIVADARLEAADEGTAYSEIDTLCEQIEQAVLTNYNIIKIIQQVAYVETHVEVNSQNGRHVAQATIEFGMEFFQSQEEFYAPVNPTAIQQVAIHPDLANVYDPTGTYTGSLFPGSVIPAPRTSGPDGRDEALVIVNLPQ